MQYIMILETVYWSNNQSGMVIQQIPYIHLLVNMKSQLTSGETWSWPVGASSARVARSTRARSCRRTRSCTAQTASGVCRAKSHRSVFCPLLMLESFSALCVHMCVTRDGFFLLCFSCSLRLCSWTSSWRSCPTTTTWRRQWKETAHLWETETLTRYPSTCTCLTL